jgi:Kelch motif
VAACLVVLVLCTAACGAGRSSDKTTPAPVTTALRPAPSTGAPASHLVLHASVTSWRLPAPVYRTVGVTLGQRIFVLGGHDLAGDTISKVYELDVATGRSLTAGTLALPTHGAAAALLRGRVLVFGGASSTVHDDVQRFDPPRHAASVVGRLPTVRADLTAAAAGNSVVLAGGFDGVGPQRDVWATGNGTQFRVIATLPQAVRYPAVVAQGDNVYVFGGLISGGEYNGTFSKLIQRVRIHERSAQVVGHLPTPLAHAMGALLGGRVLVLGGSTPVGPSAAILRFDPTSGRVIRVGHLPHPLTDAAVATISDSAYLLGGISRQPVASIIVVRLTRSG